MHIRLLPPNVKGILWALLATALLSIATAMIKSSVADFHVLQVLFIRQSVILLSVLPIIARNFPDSLKTQHPKLNVIRLLGAFTALSTGIWAVSLLPLSTAITLGFSRVFLVTLLAMYFLGEGFGRHRLFAILIGFGGVVVIMRPSVEGFANLNTIVPLVGALGAAVAVTCVRQLTKTEKTSAMLSYQAIFVGVLAGIPMFWLWVTPSWAQLAQLVGIGVVSTLGQWAGISALRQGEASLIASIGFMQMIYALILGYVFFAELPDKFTLIGAGLIIGSALYTIRREAMAKAK
jgi:drug/metabolite transporter (DMT)-like permease